MIKILIHNSVYVSVQNVYNKTTQNMLSNCTNIWRQKTLTNKKKDFFNFHQNNLFVSLLKVIHFDI